MAGKCLVYFVLHAVIYFSSMAHGAEDDYLTMAKLGQFCNATQPCDSYVLNCVYYQCDCPISWSRLQEFTPANLTCCDQQHSSGSFDETDVERDGYICAGSHCIIQGICKCKRTDSEVVNGTCVERGGFYQPCLTNNDCLNEDYGLVCLNNTCQCDPSAAVDNFSAMKRQCVGLAGRVGIKYKCTQGAFIPHMYRGHRRCQCQSKIIPDEKGLCTIVDYGGACELKNVNYTSCHSNFTCTNFVCGCPSNLQFYDHSHKSCRSLVWGPCEMNGPMEQCVENSACAINTGFGAEQAQCECLDGFVGNVEGKCELAYGSKCEKDQNENHYINVMKTKCDQAGPLACKKGKCVCQNDLQKYVESERKCFGLVGSFCDDTNPCMEGSICAEKFYGILNGRGQCGCPKGSKVVPGRRCSNLFQNDHLAQTMVLEAV